MARRRDLESDGTPDGELSTATEASRAAYQRSFVAYRSPVEPTEYISNSYRRTSNGGSKLDLTKEGMTD